MPFNFFKAHAYGNDFLFVEEGAVMPDQAADVTRTICDRHSGVGADGAIFFRLNALGASMKLYNADGSAAEVSGNGIRCLAAIISNYADNEVLKETIIETDCGSKVLTLVDSVPPQYTFRAFMGPPADLREIDLDVAGESVRVVALSVGNPQCVVLTDRLDEERFKRLGSALAIHKTFANGTNVEFVEVERPDQIRILVWERGVGSTSASGTGACASAVVAAEYGGADRSLDVVSEGGSQHVEWLDDGIYLTGWAKITARGEWLL